MKVNSKRETAHRALAVFFGVLTVVFIAAYQMGRSELGPVPIHPTLWVFLWGAPYLWRGASMTTGRLLGGLVFYAVLIVGVSLLLSAAFR